MYLRGVPEDEEIEDADRDDWFVMRYYFLENTKLVEKSTVFSGLIMAHVEQFRLWKIHFCFDDSKTPFFRFQWWLGKSFNAFGYTQVSDNTYLRVCLVEKILKW